MTEIIFLVEDDPDGGYVARAIGESIFTQAESIKELEALVRDAVQCHYPDQQRCSNMIRLVL
ncbi:2-oxoisovalerate dehydrogenase E1 subunit beta [Stenomitos frigidus]|uniref:2-oxoisovalerate dehydrogenase E1 subunit beta n=1 Tax=Stenomitos frigidus ULC18 TaxID=2107698 RepID=A0A2T1DVS3_9CYAN|nr:2-oxoisovalerate dehydrogenase E1 subunit beta [Stenomitos frigidus]PSB24616.1 2-oxoisovalerate dehydrogenase E1 subunit beta [Stenomitos frigidus ULC18]